MIFVAGGPAQGSWRLCGQVASYTKLAFSSNSNSSIPTTWQVSPLAVPQVTFSSALPEDVQIHLPRSCRDQVPPSALRQKRRPSGSRRAPACGRVRPERGQPRHPQLVSPGCSAIFLSRPSELEIRSEAALIQPEWCPKPGPTGLRRNGQPEALF